MALHPLYEEVLVSIQGANVLHVCEDRISKEERHEGLYYYDMRHSEDDWSEPVSVERSVWANFFGTVVTDRPIPTIQAGGDLELEDFDDEFTLKDALMILKDDPYEYGEDHDFFDFSDGSAIYD